MIFGNHSRGLEKSRNDPESGHGRSPKWPDGLSGGTVAGKKLQSDSKRVRSVIEV